MTIIFNYDFPCANETVIVCLTDAHAADPVTYPNYKYVLEIYDGATRIGPPLKIAPRPSDNLGVFDIGPIVRNYLSVQLNPTHNALFCQNLGAGESFKAVTLKAGEEYGYDLYPALVTNPEVKIWNYYPGRISDVPDAFFFGLVGRAATTGPLNRTVRFEDKFCFLPYFNLSGADVDATLRIYNLSSGDLDETRTFSYAGELGMNILNLSPVAINATTPGIPVDAETHSHYTIEISGQVFRFDFACEHIYTPYNLHFWNQWGGFETFPFRKVSRKTQALERKTFTQLPYRIASDGSVSYANANGVLHDQRTTYASNYTEALKINSDLLTDAEYQWLRQLVVSPIVYLDDNSGYLVPVTITDSSYEEKKIVNDKISSLTLTLDFGQTLNTQYR